MIDWDQNRDAEIAALAAKCDPPPLDELDPETLHRSIQERAIPILERRHRRAAFSRWTGRAGITIALAAGLAAILLERPGESPPPPAVGSIASTAPEVLVTADLPADDFRALISGSAEARALLLFAVEPLRSSPLEP